MRPEIEDIYRQVAAGTLAKSAALALIRALAARNGVPSPMASNGERKSAALPSEMQSMAPARVVLRPLTGSNGAGNPVTAPASPLVRKLSPLPVVVGAAAQHVAKAIAVRMQRHGEGVVELQLSRSSSDAADAASGARGFVQRLHDLNQQPDVKVIVVTGEAEVFVPNFPLESELPLIAAMHGDMAGLNGVLAKRCDFVISAATRNEIGAPAQSLARELAAFPRECLVLLKRQLARNGTASAEMSGWSEMMSHARLAAARQESSLPDYGIPAPVSLTSTAVQAVAYPSGVFVATLRDEAGRNAFSSELTRGIQEVFAHLRAERRYKVAILTGYDHYFASGGTKEGLLSIQQGKVRYSDAPLYELALGCEIPVIAAMQGHAIGAGWSFGMFCDYPIFSEESLYSSRFMRYGFTPGFGSTLVFPARFGRALGREILFTARDYTGRELKDRGICAPVVSRGQVLPTALALAHELAAGSREALNADKRRRVGPVLAHLPAVIAQELEMHDRTFVGNASALATIQRDFAEAPQALVTGPVRPDSQTSVGPDGQLEAILHALRTTLSEELQLEPAEIDEDRPFTDLGLDSISGVTWVRRVNRRFGASINASQVYHAPTLREFAQLLRREAKQLPDVTREKFPAATNGAASSQTPDAVSGLPAFPVVSARVREVVRHPLSEGQKGLWMLHRLEPTMAAYNVPVAFRITEARWTDALDSAIAELLRRHPILETVIASDEAGQPYQMIPARTLIAVERKQAEGGANAAMTHLRAVFKEPFALNQDPLMRVQLFTTSASKQEQWLLLTLHHILFDGTSLVTFIRDFLAAWSEAVHGREPAAKASNEPQLATPVFFEFVAWERAFLQSDAAQKELAYWKRQLGGELPVLDFPADRTRPAQQTFSGATVSSRISAEVSERLRLVARERKVSLFTLLLAVYKVLLHRYTRQETIVVGVPVARRPEERFADAIGCFVNMVAAKSAMRGDAVFNDYLEQLKWTVLDGLEHAQYPFSKLVSDLGIEPSATHSPVFQTVFVLQNFLRSERFDGGMAQGAGIELLADLHQEGEYDLRLEVVEQGRELTLCASYNPELYTAATMARLLEHFGNLATTIVADPGRRLDEYSCMSEAEQRRIEREWNATARAYPQGHCLHDVFATRAAEMPEAVAIVAGEERLTYCEVDRRSTLLARYLQSLGVGPERRVALCLKRSPELVIGVLGVLKAGGAYVPLDPAYPAERVRFLVGDCGATVVLTDEASAATIRNANVSAVREVLLDRDRARIEREGAEFSAMPRAVAPENLAYMIYTSGSTGTPKGVMVEHRQILNTLYYLEEVYPVGERDAYLLKTNYTFDVSLSELFGWFMGRGRLVLLPAGEERFPDRIAETIRASGVTHVNFVPSALAAFLYAMRGDERFGREGPLKYVMVAGEALPKTQALEAARFFGRAKVENIYGPTETAIYASGYSCPRGEIESAHTPTGRPLPNTRLYVLDAQRKSTGLGVAGELAIAGDGVARGYLNQAELTAARFVADPFVPGARMFLTGDLARWLPGGEIEYLGRLDQQIKIRGFRVEPGEIETCLKQHPGVRDAVVLAVEKNGSKQLVAYVVPVVGSEVEATALTQHLAAKLPDYMVPGFIVPLDAIPLTPSGKVDRRQLSSRALVRERSGGPALPQTQAESVIAGIWKKILRAETIGTTDRFFEVGGDSLLAVALADHVGRAFNCTFSAATVFKHPTIRALAEVVSAGKPEERARAATPDRQPMKVENSGATRPPGEPPEYYEDSLAIIGMSCRFPGADGVSEFWDMLREGREGGRFLSKEELSRRGVPATISGDPRYVPLEMAVTGKDEFDAEFFQLSGRHALLMDPQFRALLMHAWNAVEDAGYAPSDIPDTSVFMSAGNSFYRGALEQSGVVEKSDAYASWVLAQGGTIPTMISYCLGLSGPSLFVHSNCSSSLAGLYLAQQSVRSGASKYALVGAATLFHAAQAGYLFRPGLNFSSDGHCRTFDAAADGMVGSEGAAVVLVKRASEAWADGDPIYAVVRGLAMNNDGGAKAGFYSPGVSGQSAVIEKVLQATGIDPETIGYIEAHGTGTQLGDPVEVMALADAYRAHTRRTQFCGLGSVKTNIGHADTAAGLAGCIKLALSLQHRALPPSLNFERPNPAIDFAASPFYVVDRLQPWIAADGAPRRAALSSFGIGGTNVHAVLEESLARSAAAIAEGDTSPFVVVLSARNPERLKERMNQLRAFLLRSEPMVLADLAATLWMGRSQMVARVAFVVRTSEELAQRLQTAATAGGQVMPDGCWLGQASGVPLDDLLSEEEAEAMAVKWCEEGRLDRIAKLWVRGFTMPWSRLYPNRHFRRLHLPTYPFARDRYALPSREQIETTAPTGREMLHPLLHRNTSTLQQVQFRSRFSGQEFFLAHHVLQGRKVLPGVAYLEMARAALAQAMPSMASERIQLRDIVWLRPFVVDAEPRQAVIALATADPTRTAFEVYSEANDGGRVVHCRGTAVVADTAPVETVEAMDVVALRRDVVREPLTGEACYGAFAAAGFSYGDGFRSVKEIICGSAVTLARVELPAAERESHAAYVLHPSILDGALQAVFGAVLAASRSNAPESRDTAPLALPFALEAVATHRACPSAIWAAIRVSAGTRPGDRVQRRDIDLCDDEGRVCVSLRGYATAAVETSETQSANETLFFRPTWRAERLHAEQVFPPFSERIVIGCGVPEIRLEGAIVQTLSSEMPATGAGEWITDQAVRVFELVQAALRNKPAGPVLMQLAIPATGPASSLNAMSGLFRTARLENPKFFGQVIEVPPEETAAGLLEKLHSNACSRDDVHVRYVGGERQVFDWEEADPPSIENSYPWKSDGVYLLTGGAGGIGAHFVREILAHAPQGRVIVAGRSSRSGAELAALGLPGARVEYRVADVTRETDVVALALYVRERFGRLDGVLHAAGIIRDNFILKKTSEEFRDVLAAKVRGTILLERALRESKPEFFALFSSGVAAFGNPGQADYATANAFLDHFARALLGKAGGPRILSIDWPLWKEGGMRTTSVQLSAARGGLTPLETLAGISAFGRALRSADAQWMVLSGRADELRRLVFGRRPMHEANASESPAATVDATALQPRITAWVRATIAEVVKLAPEKIADDTSFEKLGLDSILQVTAIEKFEHAVGELAKTLLFEYTTLSEVVDYFQREHAGKLSRHLNVDTQSERPRVLARSEVAATSMATILTASTEEPSAGEAIAIVGVSGRYPLANSLEALWENLKAGRNCISQADRPDWDASFSSAMPADDLQSREPIYGGFLDRLDRFDHALFDVPLDKVPGMSPESRLFLETVWELFEDAGYTRGALKALQQRAGGVGVFVATMYNQYAWSLPSMEMAAVGSNATEWHIPNRVSHFFDLTGPSLAVNAACSGSLLAIHLACESLKLGNCAMAIAGGVNLTLVPSKYPFLKAAGVLGGGERSRSFGEGDGYIPGEGVGAVLLKPLARAQADGDRIHGVIRGSFANHTGGRQAYTAPDPTQQARLVTEALRRARVEARSISYIESAVNGSPLGDPIEMLALKKAFAPLTQDKGFCALGSVKSNLGHLEAASGISQLSKVLLQFRHRTLVPSLHSRPRNPAIKLEGTPFYVQEECAPWSTGVDAASGREWPRRSLINSVGAGGTCVNLVVEEYTTPSTAAVAVAPITSPALWLFSARSETSLHDYLERVSQFLRRGEEVSLHDIAVTLRRRNPLEVRAALIVTSRDGALGQLQTLREQRATVGTAATDAAAGIFVSLGEVATNRRAEDASRSYDGTLRAQALRWVAGGDVDPDGDERGTWCAGLPKYAFDHSHSFAVSGNAGDGGNRGRYEDVIAKVVRGDMSPEEFERFVRA